MNPTTKLKDIRQIINFILDSKGIPTQSDLIDLAVFTRQLDEWLSNGGEFPNQWKSDNRSISEKARDIYGE